MTYESNSSSDDEDIFMQGGIPKPISMYSGNGGFEGLGGDDDDDDDEGEDDLVLNFETFTKPQRRVRPSKRARISGNTMPVQKSTPPRKNAAHGTKQKKNCPVFDKTTSTSTSTSTSEESAKVVAVEACSEEFYTDADDKSAAASPAQTHAVLPTQTNQEKIAAVLRRYVKERSERAEHNRRRRRCQEKQRLESEKVRKQAEEGRRLTTARIATPVQFKVRSGQTDQIKIRKRRSVPEEETSDSHVSSRTRARVGGRRSRAGHETPL